MGLGNSFRSPQKFSLRCQQGATVKIWKSNDLGFDLVIHHGESDKLQDTSISIAQRTGPIVSIIGLHEGQTQIPLERLFIERVVSVNTAAAGGNASLMTL